MASKKSLYDLLGVAPRASKQEISRAYERLSASLQSSDSGLDNQEAQFRLGLIRQAYETLSDDFARTAYDARISGEERAIAVAHSLSGEIGIKTSGWTPMKSILTVIAACLMVGLVLQLAFMALAYRNPGRGARKRRFIEGARGTGHSGVLPGDGNSRRECRRG
jgi:curved DNA-binding protein CbpA